MENVEEDDPFVVKRGERNVSLETVPHQLDEAVDELGFGVYQFRLMVIVGLIFASEAVVIFLLTFIRSELLRDLPGATETLLTAGTSIVFFGMLVGSLGFGAAADIYGRRRSILILLLLPTFAGLLSCFSVNIWMFLLCQFVIGVGVGGGHIAPSLLMEMLPAKNREWYVVASYSWWTIGVLYLCLCAWAFQAFSWRYLTAMALFPYVICLLCYKLIPESPRFDCVHGRSDHALATLQVIARANKKPVPRRPLIAHVAPRHTLLEMLQLVFAPSLRKLTLLLWVIWGAANASYYGMIMLSTQQILGDGTESFGAIAVESAGEIPVYILLYVVSHRYGRKMPLIVSPIIAAVFLLLMKLTETEDKSFTNVVFVAEVLCAFVCRCMALFMFDLVYMYTPEAYPTAVRTSGTGTCSAAARVSGMATPFVSYTLLRTNPLAPYILFAVLLLLAAAAASMLPLETGGQNLKDEVDEEHEVELGIAGEQTS